MKKEDFRRTLGTPCITSMEVLGNVFTLDSKTLSGVKKLPVLDEKFEAHVIAPNVTGLEVCDSPVVELFASIKGSLNKPMEMSRNNNLENINIHFRDGGIIHVKDNPVLESMIIGGDFEVHISGCDRLSNLAIQNNREATVYLEDRIIFDRNLRHPSLINERVDIKSEIFGNKLRQEYPKAGRFAIAAMVLLRKHLEKTK